MQSAVIRMSDRQRLAAATSDSSGMGRRPHSSGGDAARRVGIPGAAAAHEAGAALRSFPAAVAREMPLPVPHLPPLDSPSLGMAAAISNYGAALPAARGHRNARSHTFAPQPGGPAFGTSTRDPSRAAAGASFSEPIDANSGLAERLGASGSAAGSMPPFAHMRVCKQCHESLLDAFDHCLVKHGGTSHGDHADHAPSPHPFHPDASPSDVGDMPSDANTHPERHPFDPESIGAVLASVHQIDEISDAQPVLEAPYFDIIQDPTRERSTMFVEANERIERDRWMMSEQRTAALREESYGKAALWHGKPSGKPLPATSGATNVAPNVTTAAAATSGAVAIAQGANDARSTSRIKGMGIQSGHVFSGALYKRMLDAKDREIQTLRSHLFTTMRKEQFEAGNVQKLRMALSRSVYYYTFAEEWQQSESQRLQQDVRYLKTEVSSLMAFLIHAEEERRKLNSQIEELHGVIRHRDVKVSEADKSVDEMKAKLHESFKEFLSMDDTMTRLRREAVKGTEAAESRNTILQRNLEKLSTDFEQSAKELGQTQTKIRELEFELEELVQQFNMTGESKRRSEELNIKISAELEQTTAQLKEALESIQQLTMQRSKLEADLRQVEINADTTKKDLDAQILKLTDDITSTTQAKKELESQLKLSRAENEKLATALKTLTRSKDQLESAAKAMVQKHEKEINTRDQKIKDLGDLRTEDAKTIKKIQEQKEQLIFQTTDLQNKLEHELSNVNMLTFEMAQTKRLTDEKAALLDEQIEKLTSAKTNLSNDKRQLTEKIKFVRAELRQKEDELENTKAEFENHKQEATATETGLRSELAVLHEEHAHLSKEFKSLEGKHHMVVDMSVKLKMKQDQLQKSHAGIETELATIKIEAESAKAQVARLTQELVREKDEHGAARDQLEIMTVRSDLLSRDIDTLRGETTEEIRLRNEEIKRLSDTLFRAETENTHNVETIQRFTRTVESLEQELAQTQTHLAAETAHREQLETSLHENRVAFQSERKLRIEFERMQVHIRGRQTMHELEIYEEWHTRDRKLNQISTGLHVEHDRLSSLAKLLPRADQLGNMQLANTKEFEWLLNDSADVPRDGKSHRHKSKRRHRRGRGGRDGDTTMQ